MRFRHPAGQGSGLVLWTSPLGPLYLAFSHRGITRLAFGRPPEPPEAPKPPAPRPPWLPAFLGELAAYFRGQPVTFLTVPLDLTGTPFQWAVWQAVRQIPFGDTRSYGELAQALGRPRAARAVGQALKANPVPLLIPCHRVIAAAGSLGGFSGPVGLKAWLLEHERRSRFSGQNRLRS